MIELLWDRLLALPSICSFLDSVIEDLANNRSTIIAIPPGADREIIAGHIENRLFQRNFESQRFGESVNSIEELARRVSGEEPPADFSFQAALGKETFPDVIILDGKGGSQETIRRTIKLIQDWAARIKSNAGHFPRVRTILFFLPAAYSDLRPPVDLLLSVRWWWGFPSELEIRLLTRLAATGNRGADLWRECIMAAFGAGDATLAALLFRQNLQSVPAVQQFLISYAQRAGIDQDLNISSLNQTLWGNINTEEPTGNEIARWSRGHIISSHEYGIDYHPALLALCERGAEELNKRLWRAQAPVLMPLIDRIRLVACQELVKNYGDAWFERVRNRPREAREIERLKENPYDAELGYLVTLWPSGDFPRTYFQMEKPVKYAREARNDLAHYRAVDFAGFCRLWDSVLSA